MTKTGRFVNNFLQKIAGSENPLTQALAARHFLAFTACAAAKKRPLPHNMQSGPFQTKRHAGVPPGQKGPPVSQQLQKTIQKPPLRRPESVTKNVLAALFHRLSPYPPIGCTGLPRQPNRMSSREQPYESIHSIFALRISIPMLPRRLLRRVAAQINSGTVFAAAVTRRACLKLRLRPCVGRLLTQPPEQSQSKIALVSA